MAVEAPARDESIPAKYGPATEAITQLQEVAKNRDAGKFYSDEQREAILGIFRLAYEYKLSVRAVLEEAGVNYQTGYNMYNKAESHLGDREERILAKAEPLAPNMEGKRIDTWEGKAKKSIALCLRLLRRGRYDVQKFLDERKITRSQQGNIDNQYAAILTEDLITELFPEDALVTGEGPDGPKKEVREPTPLPPKGPTEGEEPVLPAADDPQAIIAGLREQLAALGGQVEQLMAGNVEIAGLAEQRIAAAETESAQAKAAAAEAQSKLTAAETALVSARQATLHPAINGEVVEKSDTPKGDAVIVRLPDGTQFQVPAGRKMFVVS